MGNIYESDSINIKQVRPIILCSRVANLVKKEHILSSFLYIACENQGCVLWGILQGSVCSRHYRQSVEDNDRTFATKVQTAELRLREKHFPSSSAWYKPLCLPL